MATFKSVPDLANRWKIAVLAVFLAAPAARAADEQQKVFAERAIAEYQHARTEYQGKTNDVVAAWRYARACYDLVDFTPSDAKKAELANEGIGVSRLAVARDPRSAAAHYYLAMNLGRLADTKRNLSALRLVKEMETEFKAALELNDHFDFGGPARSLGLLYRDAPGWPASIGSKRKARNYLEQAMKIGPGFPENHLVLIDTSLKWRDTDAAKQQLEALDALWPEAQKSFTGENWQRDWADWTNRRDTFRKKVTEQSEPLKSLRNGR